MKPFWVTFYSYKGGVGRSMALANLATLLARRSRRVFMIDFDLEAPGLDSFREFGVEPRQAGVVEYASEFQRTKVAPDLEPFVQECKFSKPVPGKAWLMPSGRKDAAYNSKRVGLRWENLYEDGLGELFIENWKAAVFRKYRPDYVFVDSRRGLTDVGGVCTLHLPDLVVLLFGLNDQNLHGVSAVLQTIRMAAADKPPQVLPVATPVPNLSREESGLFKSRMEEAEKLLGLKIECSIGYNPQAALVEKLFTMEGDPLFPPFLEGRRRFSRIVDEYRVLMMEILDRNQDGLDSLIRKADEACENDEEEAAEHIKQVLLEDFGDRADALFNIGQIERRFRNREQAVAFWKQSVKLDPSHLGAFRALAGYLRQKKLNDDLLLLYRARLEHAHRYDPEGVSEICREQAEELMAMGQYAEAAESYGRNLADKSEKDPHGMMAALFNTCEAQRRATGNRTDDRWKSIIEIFEKDVSLENHSVDMRANIFQAMHIPYACAALVDKAKELLEKAEKCALVTGKAEKIFCVKSYTFLSVEEFLSVNKEMTTALNAGRLWDGMVLP